LPNAAHHAHLLCATFSQSDQTAIAEAVTAANAKLQEEEAELHRKYFVDGEELSASASDDGDGESSDNGDRSESD